MSKQAIKKLIQTALEQLQTDGFLQTIPDFYLDNTKDKQHGDFACNIALILAKSAKRKPRELAELIQKALPSSPLVKKTEIAGPGFINFFLSKEALYQAVALILEKKESYGRSQVGQGKRILIEYVSSNPTGPLHVGHGRHAAYGAVVADLLETIGFDVFREYYVNDAGRQMDILAASTWLRYLALCGETIILPANAYQGEYVIQIAQKLQESCGKRLQRDAALVYADLPLDEPLGGDKELYIDAIIEKAKHCLGEADYNQVFDLALKTILADIHNDLADFGVHFQNWFSERAFVQSDAVDNIIARLKEQDVVYEREGALWFRSTNYGDEKDRVLERRNGQRTYFANDLAYHLNKFERGFEQAIDIFGADHHGYIPRMKAGLAAGGIPPEKLTYLLVQFVTLYRHGQQVQMSTRSGSFVTLRELRAEVGNDAARFFYVMRKCEQHMDFDLDLAKTQSNENPVYYIQYAHARISSVFRQLKEKSLSFSEAEGLKQLALLDKPEELQLMSTLDRYPDDLENAALLHEPLILIHYLRDLAGHFHAYYNAHPFVILEEDLRNARLTLVLAARQVLANGLKLLGVSTPDSM